MIEPIVSTIEVECDRKKAFEVFTERMGQWWPLERRSMSMRHGTRAKALQVEPHLGGTLVEVSEDGTEHHWATITAFEPGERLVMDFHMGLPKENASQVEVRFVSLGPSRTKVTLTHSNFEAFGEMAKAMRGGYDSGWPIIFGQAYSAACAAA